MDSRLKHAPGVYLAGFMGSGKSTVAHLLADRLGWSFLDLDAEIEAAEGVPVKQIFETRGEPEFRRLENEMLKKLLRRIEHGMPCVIALGGGTFVQAANARLLQDHGITVWLDCPFETIAARIPDPESRPLARDPAAFRKLYEDRRAGYGLATYRIDADCDVEQAVEMILALPCWK